MQTIQCLSERQWSIEPGADYVSKYRFVVHDGEFDKETIESIWQQFTQI